MGIKRGSYGRFAYLDRDHVGAACIFCKIPVLKGEYTSIPAHIICALRFLDASPNKPRMAGTHVEKITRSCSNCKDNFKVAKNNKQPYCFTCKQLFKRSANGL